jgi:hypothetical protein
MKLFAVRLELKVEQQKPVETFADVVLCGNHAQRRELSKLGTCLHSPVIA